MNWASKMDFYKILEKKGNLRPDDVRPQISEGESLLMSLFSELSTSRAMGMGVGPIPSHIYWEAQRKYGLPDISIEVLKMMDVEFIKRQNAS